MYMYIATVQSLPALTPRAHLANSTMINMYTQYIHTLLRAGHDTMNMCANTQVQVLSTAHAHVHVHVHVLSSEHVHVQYTLHVHVHVPGIKLALRVDEQTLVAILAVWKHPFGRREGEKKRNRIRNNTLVHIIYMYMYKRHSLAVLHWTDVGQGSGDSVAIPCPMVYM